MSFRFGLGFVFAVVVLIITGNIYFGIIAYLIGSFLDFRNNPNEKKRAELTLELLQNFTYLLGHLLRVSGKNNKENFDLLCHHFVDVFSAVADRDTLLSIARYNIEEGLQGTRELSQVVARLKVIYGYHIKVSREHFIMYLFAIFTAIYRKDGERTPDDIVTQIAAIGNGLGIPTQIVYMMFAQTDAEQIFRFFTGGGAYSNGGSSSSGSQSYGYSNFTYNRSNELKKAYEILGCDENVTKSELRKIKRNLMLKWHPDKAPEGKEKEFNEKFQEINWAYDLIADHKGFN